MWISDQWQDFELIDCSEGEKLERWGDFFLIRPDPQAIWATPRTDERWNASNARYRRSETGGGSWSKVKLPESWQIRYRELVFNVKPMNFKHTGIFPEQAANWDWAADQIRSAGRPVSVLNLFAYTGGATVACAKAGASVCHVDAAKGMAVVEADDIGAVRVTEDDLRTHVDELVDEEQAALKHLLVDEYGTFGLRGHHQHDTDQVGREAWPRCIGYGEDFVLINSYTTGLSPSVLTYMTESTVSKKFGGHSDAQELGLPVSSNGLVLPCGASCRWTIK